MTRAIGKTAQEELLLKDVEEYMVYDEINGGFLCVKKRRHGTTLPGQRMESIHNKGYRTIYAGKRSILCHHLVWLWHYGEWPTYQIDHIDRDKSNNRISNLREVNNKTNSRNAKKMKNNTSGFTGVKFYQRLNKWGAFVGDTYLGLASSAQEAFSIREDYLRNHPELGYTEAHGK